jgi:hypothetical protein
LSIGECVAISRCERTGVQFSQFRPLRGINRMDVLFGICTVIVFSACAYAFRQDQPIAWQSDFPFLDHPLSEAHPGIVEVDENASPDGALAFVLFQAAPMYPASVVTTLALDALSIADKLKADRHRIGNPSIRFVALAPVKPGVRYEHVRVLALTFDTTTLLDTVTDGSYVYQDLLNSAKAVEYPSPTGQRYVRSFCRDAVATRAALFCQRELAKPVLPITE